MRDLYRPTDEHVMRLRPYFRRLTASPELLIDGCGTAWFWSTATGCCWRDTQKDYSPNKELQGPGVRKACLRD